MAHISPEANAPADVDVDRAAPRKTQLAVSPAALAMLLTAGLDAVAALSNRMWATIALPAATIVLMFRSTVVPAALSAVPAVWFRTNATVMSGGIHPQIVHQR